MRKENITKIIAQGYHNTIETCYNSNRADWVWGLNPQSRMEWIKRPNGKWNGYPPAKWINPAVNLEKNTITITTNKGKVIKFDFPPEKFRKNISTVSFKGSIFTSYFKNTITGYTLFKNKWIQTAQIKLPENYVFKTDKIGTKIINTDNNAEYHFMPTDLAETAIQLIDKLETNRLTRLKNELDNIKAKDLWNKAIKSGVRVTFNDSIDAGNCNAGTTMFCEHNKLDIKKSYSIVHLLKIGKRNQRLRIACQKAINRHNNYINAGAIVFYPMPK